MSSGDDESMLERAIEQQREWHAIADEMIAGGHSPSAYQVTLEQRKRLLARGERLVTSAEIIDEVSRCR